MAATMVAFHLGPLGEEADIVGIVDGIGGDRLCKARPAGTGLELRLRAKERLAAPGAVVDPFLFTVPIFPRKSLFRSLFPQDAVLLGCQLLLPFFIGSGNLSDHIINIV